MKIAHIVTHQSENGAFGGPTRVALAQATALADQGHQVTVIAGAPSNEASDRMIGDVRLRTFPTRRVAPFGGFAALWPLGMRAFVREIASEADIAHIHLARDLTTLPSALQLRRLAVPYVVQTLGMIDGSKKILAHLLDLLATRRALSSAACWLSLTQHETDSLRAIASPRRVVSIRNGIEPRTPGTLAGRPNQVVFLARMHRRKRPLAFVAMAELLADDLPETEFLMYGPDEGEGPAVTEAIAASPLRHRIRWEGAAPSDGTLAILEDARVYVLPSVNEVFPMTILEAFNAGTPVVTTRSLGIAEKCIEHDAAVVTDGSPSELALAVRRLLNDPEDSQRLREGAQSYIRNELNIANVAEILSQEYDRACGSPREKALD